LSPGVDLTAYRVIQEALTNAVRHAPGSAASVRVTYDQAHVTVEVTNTGPARAPSPVPVGPVPVGPVPVGVASVRGAADGRAPRPGLVGPGLGLTAPGPGYGLAGIAERVASCGGALSLGPSGAGGFTVTARLPLT